MLVLKNFWQRSGNGKQKGRVVPRRNLLILLFERGHPNCLASALQQKHCHQKQKRRGAPRRNLLILLVEQRGIEPLTSALRTRRSAKLSYCPTSRRAQARSFIYSSRRGLAAGTRIPFRILNFKLGIACRGLSAVKRFWIKYRNLSSLCLRQAPRLIH